MILHGREAFRLGSIAARAKETPRPWYRILKNNSDAAEILIGGEIGFDITAEDFIEELNQISSPLIKARINSGGGSVFDGVAIFNALAHHPARVEVQVDGLAASAAALIAMAGNKISMFETSTLMVHDPWAVVIGNAADLREMADVLDQIGGQIRTIFAKRFTGSAEELVAMFAKDTFFTAEQALSAGFADEVLEAEADPEGKAKAKSYVDLEAALAALGKKEQEELPAGDDVAARQMRARARAQKRLELLKAWARGDEIAAV